MPESHPFRRAVEARDFDQAMETLREDAVLHSPILFRGFEGREIVGQVLTHVAATLEDLHYVDELTGENGETGEKTVALRFKARVEELELEGIDFLELDEEGRVKELTVFMRPMSALTRFNERMAERLGVPVK